MDKVVEGINSACTALQALGGAILVLFLIITGIGAIKNGAQGKIELKENILVILMGAALVFAAGTIGKTISSWFI